MLHLEKVEQTQRVNVPAAAPTAYSLEMACESMHTGFLLVT